MFLDAISKLDPTDFENFAYDLLQSAGMRNMVWRTPGADGGRDIEGQALFNDLSGAITVQKWYVECKRYSTSVDWPTLWGKIAYADNHHADYLLLVTNNNPSPNCETQIATWNGQRKRPQVRVWRGYELDKIAQAYPAVATKYGLRDKSAPLDVEFLSLLMEVTKVAQASYSALEFECDPRPGLEVAAALAELISLRMAQVRDHGRISESDISSDLPAYDWVKWNGPVRPWETAGIRAFLCAYRYFLVAEGVNVLGSGEETKLVPIKHRGPLTPAVETSLRNIALWSDIEMRLLENELPSIGIRPRARKA